MYDMYDDPQPERGFPKWMAWVFSILLATLLVVVLFALIAGGAYLYNNYRETFELIMTICLLLFAIGIFASLIKPIFFD